MNIKNKRGFTLPEVIISMGIMVIVIFSATDLVVSIIRSNSENINRLIAYGLAQEGLEGFRNIRDSNWLLGAGFQGKIKDVDDFWGEPLPTDKTIYFTIDYRELEASDFSIENPFELSGVTPWFLMEIDGPEDESAKLKQQVDEGEVRYRHVRRGDPTPFSRYLIVTPKKNKYVNKYVLSSIVTWEMFGVDKELRLDTELTNWKD